MAKKYYAVKVGKSVGIFNNWDDCKKQVAGFSGAIYKSFPSFEEAKEFLENGNEKNETKILDIDEIEEDEIIAYVDGSYKKDSLEYGYGVVLILKDEVIEFDGRKLYRIKALKDFNNVKEGELGGYIESEQNLSQEGNAWVYGFLEKEKILRLRKVGM